MTLPESKLKYTVAFRYKDNGEIYLAHFELTEAEAAKVKLRLEKLLRRKRIEAVDGTYPDSIGFVFMNYRPTVFHSYNKFKIASQGD